MKKTRLITIGLLILALGIFTASMVMAGSGSAAADAASDGPGPAVQGPIAQPVGPFVPTGGVLHDNGPLVTHPGGGAGGADASALQTALGLNIYGFGHAVTTGFRVADDFTVTDPSGWEIDSFLFYAYQTGSTTSSTITSINYRIWNGNPSSGGAVIFGDTTTNRLVSSTWSNIYRSIDTDVTASNRPIMVSTASAGVTLPPGTYWLDWQTGGSLASGPWAPPISIVGTATTGNGLQYNGSAWAALIDTGTAAAPQGLPFQVIGSIGLQPAIVLTKTVGTDSGSCATSSTISAPYGSTVYYCYTVTNTGNVTLTDHTVTDDVLGTVLGPDFSYNLVPGASAFITASYVLMTETITNNALWEAYVIDTGIIATATASATVTGSPTDVTISGVGGQTSSTVVMVAAATGVILLMGVALYLRRQHN